MTHGAAQILAALQTTSGQSQSGEALSSLLGVSRNQVWKHIEALRALGYAIDGVAGGGYQLRACPDRLHAEQITPGLRTQWLARHYHYFPEIDSTNRVAFELARQGAPHGTTVVAEAQTQGRGRLQRSFFSPANENLYTSIVLRPNLTLDRAATTVLTAAVAVAETIRDTLHHTLPTHPASEAAVTIKWPNDVLLRGLKTSGILMELQAEATRVGFLILGIGVNLNTPREKFPDEFRDSATSLASHCGQSIQRVRFAQVLYNTLEEVFDLHFEAGFSALRPRFEALFQMPGTQVTISNAGEREIDGIVQELADDGALVVQTANGKRLRILAGDVRVRQSSANRNRTF